MFVYIYLYILLRDENFMFSNFLRKKGEKKLKNTIKKKKGSLIFIRKFINVRIIANLLIIH